MQNHALLAISLLFGMFVFVGCCSVGGLLPQLVKMLFGVETVFSRSGMAMLNTTFFMAMLCITYLCVDPILKAIYVLRVFYGESRQSGEDLRAMLKSIAAPGQRLAARTLILLLLATAASPAAAAEPAAPPAPNQTIAPDQLDHAISGVINRSKYSWRMPREKTEASDTQKPGVLARFFERIGNWMKDALKTMAKWLERIFQKIFGRLPSPGSPDFNWAVTKQMLLFGLLALVASALALLAIRFWRRRRNQPELPTAEAVQAMPDLTDEHVAADQLPEDGWSKLARELLAGGEFRLALRAFYLASLAHLAERNLLSLARFKSNRDYERELQRRAHAFPQVVGCFGENVSAFDRVWYGRHEATGEVVNQFAANVERIKGGGAG